ncbi:high choriolytic enzyme 1-like isoform X3 [Paramacrobiotus metropolitanus]|uniref:high choriolytic enzyme 1-like isoform X3 n=1 Tax=Paramacrobiotus metropolitanus TaxID=2943436 RepID=UPI002445B294|nr:high choriolytic enzyme 1-like isoform X3 [Paramacrobiotus metropolitanus]
MFRGLICFALVWYFMSQCVLSVSDELPTDWRNRLHPSITSEKRMSQSDIIWVNDTMDNGMFAAPSLNDTASSSLYWPRNGRCIPYSLHPSVDHSLRMQIQTAMKTIERRTECLSFTPRTNESEYIQITSYERQGCESEIGRKIGRATRTNLGKGCLDQGTILHELLHALGFYHEQNRPDRDKTTTTTAVPKKLSTVSRTSTTNSAPSNRVSSDDHVTSNLDAEILTSVPNFKELPALNQQFPFREPSTTVSDHSQPDKTFIA